MQDIAKNGAAVKTIPKTAAPATTPTDTNPTLQLPKPPEPEVQPIEDRLHRLSVLWDLQKKHAKLNEAERNLQNFTTQQNREESELNLEDDEGNRFSTRNPFLIAEVTKLLFTLMKGKKAEVEKQIVF